jgi:hypothetical protein
MLDPAETSKKPPKASKSKKPRKARGSAAHANFPKHAISACLRIAEAVLEQNAGKESTYKEAAKFAGVG